MNTATATARQTHALTIRQGRRTTVQAINLIAAEAVDGFPDWTRIEYVVVGSITGTVRLWVVPTADLVAV
jgi:hypothetical protein